MIAVWSANMLADPEAGFHVSSLTPSQQTSLAVLILFQVTHVLASAFNNGGVNLDKTLSGQTLQR